MILDLLQPMPRFAAALLLAVSLLFGQMGVGWIHDPHDFHTTVSTGPSTADTLLPHGEHCQVCMVDLFSPFFPPSAPTLTPFFAAESDQTIYIARPAETARLISRGRAPPALL